MYQHIIDYYYRLANVCEKGNLYIEALDYEKIGYRYMINQIHISSREEQYVNRAIYIADLAGSMRG